MKFYKIIPFQNGGQNSFLILCNNANLCYLARKRRGRCNFFFVSKEVYLIVRQLEKKNGQNSASKNSKMRENKCWVHRNPPWSLQC